MIITSLSGVTPLNNLPLRGALIVSNCSNIKFDDVAPQNLLCLFLIMITGSAGEVSVMKGDVKLFSLQSGEYFQTRSF